MQALQEQEQAYTYYFLHAAPKNAVEGVSVLPMAKIAIGKENRDKMIESPSDLEQGAVKQERIAAELSERERLITNQGAANGVCSLS